MTLDQQLAQAFLAEHSTDAALALERMPPARRAEVLRAVPEAAAPAVGRMTAAAAADALARLNAADAARVLNHVPIDTAIPVLRRLPDAVVAQVTAEVQGERRESMLRVLRYPQGSAGALMDPVVLALPDDITVPDARLRLRRESQGLLHYLYVVDRAGLLVGVLDIPELMRARSRQTIRDLMHDRVEHVPAWTPGAAVRMHPGWRSFHALPVTDDAGRLVGAIRYQTLRRLEQDVDSARGQRGAALTAGALGELFHLGMAGFVEGVAAAAAPRERRAERVAADAGGAR